MYDTHTKRLIAATRAKLRSRSGFSLVELLIASFMLAIVSTAAFDFYQNQHQQYIRQTDVADTQQNIRVTMQELTRQIRQAGYGAFGLPAVEISDTNDSLLVRYKRGGSVHEELYYVQVQNDGTSDLMAKLDANAPEVFAEGIDTVRFVGGSPGSGIKWIDVDIVASGTHQIVDNGSQATSAADRIQRRLSSTVTLRNR